MLGARGARVCACVEVGMGAGVVLGMVVLGAVVPSTPGLCRWIGAAAA